MKAAAWMRDREADTRLMLVDPREGGVAHGRVGDLASRLRAGDVVVVNDAATIPASLRGEARGGASVELRLAGMPEGERWPAVTFGAGSWRDRTEDRAPPPALRPGDRVRFGDVFSARVTEVDPEHPRLVRVAFDREGDALWEAIYAHGRPVQYSYLKGELPLWGAQTPYASRPWSVEMPSAGRALGWSVLRALRERGVSVVAVTHAAGLSSTGDPALDARLPLPERYAVSDAVVDAIARARAVGGRVVAVGTSVVRALESASRDGRLRAGEGVTDLRVDARTRLRVVDGLLTGMHEPGTSHYALMRAFASAEVLDRVTAAATREGYLLHEFGDSALLLAA